MLIIHISPFGLNLLLLKLKIENWKDCNKIIFKCVNSTVWPFLIFFSVWTVIFVSCTVNPCEVTVHAWGKKWGGNVKHGRSFQWNPNGLIIYRDTQSHIVTVWIQGFLQNPAVRFPFFFFCFHAFRGGRRQILLFMRQMSQFTHYSGTVYALLIGSTTTLFF